MSQEPIPQPGQVVRVRTRTYLVDAAEPAEDATSGTVVRLSCLDDDAQGQPLEVVWELELDGVILDREAWDTLGQRGFDDPRHFGAYMRTIRWNCVTATDPKLFQAPFRAGIRIDPYQLEPLSKALLLPRVNLFIADDVGLGKTIEAGLIATELLLRRRVRDVVVACPPTMILQWKDELESRFGLTFEVMDRTYVERVRQERGYGVNPWTTFPRFLISHRLLIDESYVGPMRVWLENLRPGSLLILDEAHHAAPSSGARYAIDSQTTRAIRDIAPRFEHRLFLSATPHNGHSNSFSALLELMDPQRFTRGVKVRKGDLGPVMVRRLKDDIREIVGGFPRREPVQMDLLQSEEEAPELTLSRMLDDYRQVRHARMSEATKREQAEAALLVSGLQQRLLSSVEAFARTLAVHRRTMERVWATGSSRRPWGRQVSESVEWMARGVDSDDDREQLTAEEREELEAAAVVLATEGTAGNALKADVLREKQLLDEMRTVAEELRGQPDARLKYLVGWIGENMCPAARLPGAAGVGSVADGSWSDLRIIIFTEYEATLSYLKRMLDLAIRGTDLAERRIEIFHGPTSAEKREAIKKAFNAPPLDEPVRILLASDAAREGLNLQARCHHLFHFDVPWNPGRLEQRNGRIDRKLQEAPVVYCHYFYYRHRPEDRILRTLVRKTNRIRKELGSLSPVLESRLEALLKPGIERSNIDRLVQEIEDADIETDKRATMAEELEETRERQDTLHRQIERLSRQLEGSRRWVGVETDHLREAISCSLELMGAKPLELAGSAGDGAQRFRFPDLDTQFAADPTWGVTLDTLRALPRDGERGFRWRKEAPMRPVTFTAPTGLDDSLVQLHLSHRVVQRLLGRFLAQGFVHHDLSRACLAQSHDGIARVVLLGRLSVYGRQAIRLHEEVVTVTAKWLEPSERRGPLSPYEKMGEATTVDLLEGSLRAGAHVTVPATAMRRLLASVGQDVKELLPHLESRGEAALKTAAARLTERARMEADTLRNILEEQRTRVEKELAQQMPLPDTAERRQYEANRRYWQRWLDNVDGELKREPARILDFYSVATYRIEPIGVAYLWPAGRG